MKKLLILFLFLVAGLNLANFGYSQQNQNPPNLTPSVLPTSPDAWRYFYDIFRPSADIRCLEGNSTLEKIGNCITDITRALRYLGIILFVFGLTYVAGLFVLTPFKQDAINQGKKILIWIMIGFIILFTVEKIMEAIIWIAEGK